MPFFVFWGLRIFGFVGDGFAPLWPKPWFFATSWWLQFAYVDGVFLFMLCTMLSWFCLGYVQDDCLYCERLHFFWQCFRHSTYAHQVPMNSCRSLYLFLISGLNIFTAVLLSVMILLSLQCLHWLSHWNNSPLWLIFASFTTLLLS